MNLEQKLNILGQMIEGGEVDPMETIRNLTKINADLLEACKEALNIIDFINTPHLKDQLQQAIQKAEED